MITTLESGYIAMLDSGNITILVPGENNNICGPA
jgi:hypothetical protein